MNDEVGDITEQGCGVLLALVFCALVLSGVIIGLVVALT